MTASLASITPAPPASGTPPANGGGAVDSANPDAFSQQLAQQRAQQRAQQPAKDHGPGDGAVQPPAPGPRDAARRGGQPGAANGTVARPAPSHGAAAERSARAGAEAGTSPADATAAQAAADRHATPSEDTDDAAGQPLSLNELLRQLQGADNTADRDAAAGPMPAGAVTAGRAAVTANGNAHTTAAAPDATDASQSAPGLAALQAGSVAALAGGATGDGASGQPTGGAGTAADAASALGGAGGAAPGAASAAAAADAAAGTSTSALQAGTEVAQVESASLSATPAAGQAGVPGTAGSAPAAPLLATPAGGSSAPLPEARLAASPGHADFAPQLGAQISVFVRDGLQQARLQLNPAEMGPITVQIRLDGGNAQVHLAAEHAATRQALEQAMPTLASSLRDSGLTLTGGGVFEQPRQPGSDGQDPGRPGTASSPAADPDIGDGPVQLAALPSPAARRGVVDLVA